MGGSAGGLLTSLDASLGELFGDENGFLGLEGARKEKAAARAEVGRQEIEQERLRAQGVLQAQRKDVQASKAGASARRASSRASRGPSSGGAPASENLGSASRDFLGL